MLYLASEELWLDLVRREEFIAILAIALGCTVGIVAIVSGSIMKVVVSRQREQTKRELAAYIAEGTLEPDQAVAIINSGRPKWEGSDGSEILSKRT
jgi:hypothetical protein